MKLGMKKSGRAGRGGFSLVETTVSIGIISFALLTLIPMLALGLKSARTARDERACNMIVRTLAQQAKQGSLTAGPSYIDVNGTPCAASQAAFTAQASLDSISGSSASRLTVRVIPSGSPASVRTYAVVYQGQ